MLDKEDAWVLDKALLGFVGDVLKSISAETKVRIMRVLAVCALKESFVAFLHQVRTMYHEYSQFHPFLKIHQLFVILLNLHQHHCRTGRTGTS